MEDTITHVQQGQHLNCPQVLHEHPNKILQQLIRTWPQVHLKGVTGKLDELIRLNTHAPTIDRKQTKLPCH